MEINRMKKRVALIFLLICVVLLSCNQSLQKIDEEQDITLGRDDLRTLRVAVQEFYISTPVGFIIDNGIDAKFGLEIIPVVYRSGAEQILDIEADVFDVATIGAAFLYPLVEDTGVLIGAHIRSKAGNAIYVREDSEILQVLGFNPTFPDVYGAPETIKGSTILLRENTTLQYLGMKWLESMGVRQEAVEIVDLDFREAFERFMEGEGDIIVLPAPYSYMAEAAGLRQVADTRTLHTEMYEVILATRRAHDEMEEELLAFLKCLLYANQLLEEDFSRKVDAVERWYLQHGQQISRDMLERESRDKIFITRENFEIERFGEFEMRYAEYMAIIGNISARALPNVERNIDKDLFRRAFLTEQLEY
jgi:NitT/TauT family transport system substrate-binding protein